MSLAGWLNTAWMCKCAPAAWAFRRATRHVAATQSAVLSHMLHANAQTEFGRKHGFHDMRTPDDFRQRVPLSRYEDYADAVDRIGAGHSNVLTSEPVKLLEPTSGTTSGEKLIPYTAGLRRQFQRAISTWMFDLLSGRPALRNGRAYWSISPALGAPRRTSAGIRIGFEEDAEYLGSLERFALDRLLVAPGALAEIQDLDACRYATLLRLLGAADLALVSVWSPTFLTALLAPLQQWWPRLVHDMRAGSFHPPAPVPSDFVRRIRPARNTSRAALLESVFRSRSSWPEKLERIWPRLALISCWGDAYAGRFLADVQALFPHVEIQPKGLLATEGCVSIPLLGRDGAALALRSHFFEFQQARLDGAAGACLLAHELQLGDHCRVIVTTAGGLYRYQLQDEVEIVGFENQCPLLRFLGKADQTSDLVGEKLAEPHVRRVLERCFAARKLMIRFALLTPVPGRPPHYRLYVQPGDAATVLPEDLGQELEAGLAENPHYRYAVALGQLASVDLQVLDTTGESAWHVYERHCLALGQRAGNVKPLALDPRPGWENRLA